MNDEKHAMMNTNKNMPEEKLIVSLRTPPAASPGAAGAPAFPPPRRRARTVSIVIILIVLAGAAWWYLMPGKQVPTAPGAAPASTAAGTQSASAAAIIAKVGALIELPKGETPTIATVTDPSKLQDQAFFANAKAGDIVLIYTGAREAYLYDPVQNKLVEVAPITTGTVPTVTPHASSTPQ